MPFPWEVDAQPVRRGKKYTSQKRALVAARRLNYQDAGHPPWYGAYLKTEHWKAFKERWKKSGRKRSCMICGERRYELHHWTYERIGNEHLSDVVPLCRAHHLRAHARERSGIPLAEAHTDLC